MNAVVTPRRIGWSAAAVALPLAAAAFGYALAFVGGMFAGDRGPMVVLLAPLVPAVALAAMARPLLGILAVFVVFPVGFTPLPGVPLDLVQGTIIGVSVLVAVRRIGAADRLIAWSPAFWWMVALLGWTLLGSASALDPALSMRRLLVTAAQLLFGAAIVAACRTRGDVRMVAFGLLLVVAAVGLTTLGGARHVQSDFGGAVVSGRASGMFSEPNQLGSFSAVASLVGIGLALGLPERRHRRIAAALTTVTVLALLLSLSRGAWIGFGAGMLVLLVAVPRARRVLGVGTLALFVVALAYGALRPQSPEVHVVGARFASFTGEKNPYDDRPAIWAEARREIAADPLTGQGLGNFPLVAQRSTSQAHTAFPPHAHNLFLNWAAETGLPGLACIVGFAAHLGVLARRALRRMRLAGRPRDAALLAGLGAAGVAVLGQGLVDYTLWSSVVFTELWAVLGATAAMIELERRT